MEIRSTTTKKTMIELDKFDIIDLLKAKKIVSEEQCKNVHVYLEVPSGGDWSGMNLEVSKTNTIKVTFETIHLENSI